MEWKTVMIGLIGLFGLYLVGTVLFKPLRFIIRLVAWALLGVVLFMAINTAFGHFGLHIPINPVTIFTAGLLQLPGVVLLVVLSCMFAV